MLLFDIDGVIRDVSGSYRRAIQDTVQHFSGWRPEPGQIDSLKAEGRWNNDWEASLELLRRQQAGHDPQLRVPTLAEVVDVFSDHYFGGDPDGDPAAWRGLIGNEPLLVEGPFFAALEAAGIAWGFVSGAEPPSARYVLERRLGLNDPPLIAMGEAPDKPDPTGLLRLATRLLQAAGHPGPGAGAPPVAYLGDTVADVLTVQQARQRCPEQAFLALGVAPPHLQAATLIQQRHTHEQQLQQAGADAVIAATAQVLDTLLPALSGLVPEAGR